MMAAVAKERDDRAGTITTGGSSTAYTATSNQSFSSLASGLQITIAPHVTNGTDATLNVDSLGGKPLRISPNTALPAATFRAGTPYTFTYFTTNSGEWILNGAFLPTGIAASGVSNTPAGNIVATDVQTAINELDTEKAIVGRTLTAAGLVTGGGTLAADRTFTVTAATQSDMETGTSTSTAVTPGVQKHHPLHPKAWAYVTVSAGVPSLAAGSGFSSSITDSGVGDHTLTLSAAMSSANYGVTLTPFSASARIGNVRTITTTTIRVDFSTSEAAAADPEAYTVVVWGDLS